MTEGFSAFWKMGGVLMQVYRLESGYQSGAYNMALDEALLECIRNASEQILLVRTYCWETPTLSLGVNQQVQDIRFLLDFYGKASRTTSPVEAVVRRPTGGRAILHGEDISYSFITNDPVVLKLSLKESYAIYAGTIRDTLDSLDLSATFTGDAHDKDYLRSPVCFETHTASDLVGEDGKKLTGSAQLRRAGGLLQHGAAFLEPYGVTEAAFNRALFDATEKNFGLPLQPFEESLFPGFNDSLAELEAAYWKESGEILANAPVISGSHLEPASS